MAKANGLNGKGTPETASPSLSDAYKLPPNALYGVTEIFLSNGLRVWVYQKSQADYNQIIQQWKDAHPEVDEKQYERPVPEDEATIPGQMLSASSNPAYQDAMRARLRSLSDYLVHTYILSYTDFPDYTDEELITRFERVISRKRKGMVLPDDAWEATLFHAILETQTEQQQIVNAAEKNLSVQFGEVIDSVAIFRPVDTRDTHQRVPQETPAQSTVTEIGIQQDQI